MQDEIILNSKHYKTEQKTDKMNSTNPTKNVLTHKSGILSFIGGGNPEYKEITTGLP
jgi:hypothetical protein